jgi:hypothetical protein
MTRKSKWSSERIYKVQNKTWELGELTPCNIQWSAQKLNESIVNDRKHHSFEVVARIDASLAAQLPRSDKLIFIGQAKQTTLLSRNTVS